MGTAVSVRLALPSGSTVELNGEIQAVVDAGEMDGRGPGIDIALRSLPQSVLWLIESALSSAGLAPATGGAPTQRAPSPAFSSAPSLAPSPGPVASSQQAIDQGPSLDEGHNWVSAESDLVQALWQELGSMSKMNAFQLLDVPSTASDSEVRAAFGALSKKYHPDRFARYESYEIRELANEVFILLRDAYRAIADEAGRKQLLKKLQPPGAGRATPKPAGRLPLPLRVDTASDALPTRRREAPLPAPPLPAPVSEPKPVAASRPGAATPMAGPRADNSGENRVNLGLRILESGQYEQALQILQVESRKNPNDRQARAGVALAEGRLALLAGDRLEAAQYFESALDFDPSNERAAREISELRRFATSQRRGLLSKLMKKV